MRRREFLRISAAAAAAFCFTGPLAACRKARKGAAAALGAREIISRIRSGALPLGELAREVADSAEAAQELYRPFIGLRRESVLAEFRRLEGRAPSGPLFGMPLAVKDNLRVQGYPLTGGLRLQKDPLPSTADSWAVARLRAAGAVPFARTNLTEMALGVITNSRAGGITDNPLLPGHLSGGSSGGSAAAVAAGVCPAALATDTSGSVRIPAALCGLWGIRLSRARVQHDGLLRISETRDSIGPITRSASDLSLVAAALLGVPDPAPAAGGLTVLVDETLLPDCDPRIVSALEAFVAALQAAGVKTRRTRIAAYEEVARWAGEDTALGALELEPQVKANFGVSLNDPVTRTFLVERTRRTLESLQAAHEKLRGKTRAAIEATRAKLASRVLAENLPKGTLLLMPTTLALPLKWEESTRLHPLRIFELYTRACVLAPCLKAPALSLPVRGLGMAPGIGLQLHARPGEDEALLAFAAWLEGALPPVFRAPS